MLNSTFQTGIWSGLGFRRSAHASTPTVDSYVHFPAVSRIDGFLVIHYFVLSFFFFSIPSSARISESLKEGV